MTKLAKRSVYESLSGFVSNYGVPPYVLNLYGKFGIGKTTMAENVIKEHPRRDEFEIIDLTDKFEDNPEALLQGMSHFSYTPSLSGKLPIYFLRYPSNATKSVKSLKRFRTPTILITDYKVYQLEKSATYVSMSSPTSRQMFDFAKRYISDHQYQMPPSIMILSDLVNKSLNYADLISNIETVQPDYDLTILPDYEVIDTKSDFDLVQEFLRGKEIMYYTFQSPVLQDYIVHTVASAYHDGKCRRDIAERMALINRYSKRMSANIHQVLINNIIDVAPTKAWVERPIKPVGVIPWILRDMAKRVTPDDATKAARLMMRMHYYDPQLSQDDVKELAKYYNRMEASLYEESRYDA